MTTLTWLGEDDPEINYAGPSFTTWGGLKFPKDKPVEVNNPDMIRRARGNRFFKVNEPPSQVNEPPTQFNVSAGTLDSASAPPASPPQKRGPGRPPKVRDPVAGED